jgi:hypothetical protein
MSYGLLGLSCINLGRESLTATDCFAGNGLDAVVLCFGMDSSLEHFLEDPALVGSFALLQFAVVREFSAKAGKEVRIQAIYESLAGADKKHLLMNEGVRSGKDCSTHHLCEGLHGWSHR